MTFFHLVFFLNKMTWSGPEDMWLEYYEPEYAFVNDTNYSTEAKLIFMWI